MSVLVLSQQCSSEIRIFGETFPKEPDHEACPGGETIPDVMGGWMCSCDCHHRAPVEQP